MKEVKRAFTMAEILISLTIIGIIAAITLPALRGNVNERVWETQRKALESRLAQSLALLPALNGYGVTADNAETASKATMAFINDGLSKVLKLSGICDKDHMRDCGIASNYTNLAGNTKDFPTKLSEFNSNFTKNLSSYVGGTYIEYFGQLNTPDTDVAAVKTKNGESMVVIYNPKCINETSDTMPYWSEARMCVNFIYDLNGKGGPNTVGKDIGFITAMDPTDSVVLTVLPYSKDISGKKYNEALTACGDIDESLKMPDRDEITVMFYNNVLIGMDTNAKWSMGPTVQKADASNNLVDYNWSMTQVGYHQLVTSTSINSVRCVKQ